VSSNEEFPTRNGKRAISQNMLLQDKIVENFSVVDFVKIKI